MSSSPQIGDRVDLTAQALADRYAQPYESPALKHIARTAVLSALRAVRAGRPDALAAVGAIPPTDEADPCGNAADDAVSHQ